MLSLLKEVLGLLKSIQKGLEVGRIDEVNSELNKYINQIEKQLEIMER